MSTIVVTLLNLFTLLLFVTALASWFRVSYDSPFRPVIDGLHRITDPVLRPVRQVIPPIGGFDLSIIVVILVIRVILVPLARNLPG
ncbi:MAG: YggT family protein [Actinomycetota bacterium]